MIVVDVISHEGMLISEPLSARFDETGGSIGRGDTNRLILPDPERRISRVHAIVAYQNGQYWIQNKGSAIPIKLNGKTIGQGGESPIKAGDQLIIGGYTLVVSSSVNEQDAVTQIHSNSSATTNVTHDPLDISNSSHDDPFADLMPSKSMSESLPETTKEDYDFGSNHDIQANSESNVNQTFEKLPDDLFGGAISSQQSAHSISKIFGLDEQEGKSNLFDLENNLSGADNVDANNLLDPLLSMNEQRARTSKSSKQSTVVPDNVLEVNSYFKPPKISDHSQFEVANEVRIHGDDDPNMVLSWERQQDDNGEIKTVIIKGGAKFLDSKFAREEQKTQTNDGEGKNFSPSVQNSFRQEANAGNSETPRKAKEIVNSNVEGNSDLLKAFLIGAGIPDLKNASELTPETMQRLGQIFRTMVQGTLDLLLARAAIKQEVRAEMTMIVARENNPLKFSPNAEAALNHLLSTSQKGFMEPLEAIEDAYDDLRSHQFGFMAGMRAALRDVLLRFNPERLERRLEERNVIDTLLPMSRKARLWNLFENLYGDISQEAEEDFHALFGKEFVKAYEEQIKRLEQDKK